MKANGEILARVRTRLGLTKNAASEKAGCTPKTYAKYEREGMEDSTFVEVCRTLGARVDDERTVTIHCEDGSDPIVLNTIITLGNID